MIKTNAAQPDINFLFIPLILLLFLSLVPTLPTMQPSY